MTKLLIFNRFLNMFFGRLLGGKSAKIVSKTEAEIEEKVRKIGIGMGVRKKMRKSVKTDASK